MTSPSPTAQAKTVLIVDDDEDIRDAVGAVLESRGWFVTTSPDGRDALRLLIGGSRPSVILLDLMMPNVDGIWFREAQLRDPKLARIPVIVLTAFSTSAAPPELFANVPVVRKPFDVEVL